MVNVTIISLIYKSISLADWVYHSVLKYTPMIARGQADFLFVANDPTDALVKHLIDNNYPFVINENKILSNEELFSRGYGMPEYMHRVYRGYNAGILHAKGEQVVLVNSDNFFSPDWLENLLKYSTFKTVISSELVEPGHEKFSFFPTALRADFGKTPASFSEDDFINFVMNTKKTGLKEGGAYMPCLLYRDVAIYAGLYPEGNIAERNFETISRYGDEFFFDKLKALGVEHYTAMDSIVYHLKEGERGDTAESAYSLDRSIKERYLVTENKHISKIEIQNLNVTLNPSETFFLLTANNCLKILSSRSPVAFGRIPTYIPRLVEYCRRKGLLRTSYAIAAKVFGKVKSLFF